MRRMIFAVVQMFLIGCSQLPPRTLSPVQECMLVANQECLIKCGGKGQTSRGVFVRGLSTSCFCDTVAPPKVAKPAKEKKDVGKPTKPKK